MKILNITLAALLVGCVAYMAKDAHDWQTSSATVREAQTQREIDKQFRIPVMAKQMNAQAEAITFCKNAMTQKLKSPASAVFPSASEKQVEYLGDGKYKVSSYVDSQNRFGAMLRTNFTCTAHTPNGVDFYLDQVVTQ